MGTWKAPWEDKGRDWGNTAEAKKHQTASKPAELGERPGTDSPSQSSEGTNPAGTLISDF